MKSHVRRSALTLVLLGGALTPGVATASPWGSAAAMVDPADPATEAEAGTEAASDEAGSGQVDPDTGRPNRPTPPTTRVPRLTVGAASVVPWTRLTVFTEWYRNNHNLQESDDGFVSLVGRLNLGVETRLRKVTIGTQIRVDGQKVWFPSGQNCEGDCVEIGDDARLERVTVRADTKRFSIYAGDFNVNFGRGVALSVRKIDEIGVDASIKGGRADFRSKEVRATAIAGFANRQNSDFATRQLIPDPGFPAKSYTFSQDTEDRGCNVSGWRTPEVGNPWWTVCSDLLMGGRLEGTLPGKVDLGAHYVHIDFGNEITDGVIDEHLHVIGGDVARSRIAKVWDVFVGAAGVLRNPQVRGVPEAEALSTVPLQGYGIYGSNTLRLGTTTLLVEGKHYRDYLVALTQNSLLKYSEHPTLEREDQAVPGNMNATGARVRLDHLIRDKGLTLYVNSLEYLYNDTVGFSQFTGDNARLASHNYGGIIWRKPHSDFVLQVSTGYRYERWRNTPRGHETWLRRRFPHAELYVSIPVARRRGLQHAIAIRGEGRWENLVTSPVAREDFFRGLFTLGYSLSPWFSISWVQGIDTEAPVPADEIGLTDERCEPGANSLCRPHLWPGVQAQVNMFNSSFLRLFAGRRFGGPICVNGSCRVLPDFEGVRGELVIAF